MQQNKMEQGKQKFSIVRETKVSEKERDGRGGGWRSDTKASHKADNNKPNKI